MRKTYKIIYDSKSDRYYIKQRFSILFGLFKWYDSPNFTPPHWFTREDKAIQYIEEHSINPIIIS